MPRNNITANTMPRIAGRDRIAPDVDFDELEVGSLIVGVGVTENDVGATVDADERVVVVRVFWLAR